MDLVKIATEDDGRGIKLPEEFKIDDDQVYVKKVGDVIHLIPYHTAWKNFFNSTTKFSEDFMETRDQGEDQERESFD